MVFDGDFGRVLDSPRRATERQSVWVPAGGYYLEFNPAAQPGGFVSAWRK
jgi:hypothetical protein